MVDGLDWLGVDVGWVFPAADSDGAVYHWPWMKGQGFTPVQAGPVTIHFRSGATIERPPYDQKDIATMVARSTPANIRIVALGIVKKARETDRGIALEDWWSFSRRKKAWIRVWQAIMREAEPLGIDTCQVDRAYTSQTCPDCGFCSRTNRPTRDTFLCERCGLMGHADVIAARNIAARAQGLFVVDRGTCTTRECGRAAERSGLCSFCYRWKRKHGRTPMLKDLAERLDANDLAKYRAIRRARGQRERQERRDASIAERLAESYRTHDAWGNPLPEVAGEALRT